MENQRQKENSSHSLKKHSKNKKSVLVAMAIEKGSSREGDKGSSSPLLDDFDEQLCLELEEVGKELDRYKEEASQISRPKEQEPAAHPAMVSREPTSSSCCSPSPCASPSPVLTTKGVAEHKPVQVSTSNSLCATELRGADAKPDTAEVNPAASAAAANSPTNTLLKEGSEDENECQQKALDSLKASLVDKVRMLVIHKKNLALQKDLLLKDFDGDISKLGKNLQENLDQSKQIDNHIQSLNAQITMTNKKIVDLRSRKAVSGIKNESFVKQNDGSLVHEKNKSQAPSEVNKDLCNKTDNKVCEKSNTSLVDIKSETSPGKGAGDTPAVGGNCAVQSSKLSDVGSNTVSPSVVPASSHPHPEPCSTHLSSLPKPSKLSEVQERREFDVEKLSGQLAMHPSSKNTTLWCNTCNLFFASITSYLKHLEASEHLDRVETMGEKWLYKLFTHTANTSEEEDGGSTQEALGVEFLRSAKVIFCSLCECVLVTREAASSHSQSLQHTSKYKEYLVKNTNKELVFLKAKMMAFTEYCKRRKATPKDKKQKTDSKDKYHHQKEVSKVDENTSMVESSTMTIKQQKVSPPKDKEVEALPHEKNGSSSQQVKVKGCTNVTKEGPLMPQKINVNIKTGKSMVGGGIKRTTKLPFTNKRQKVVMN